MHTEIPVKVNAWVNEGAALLVEALNTFPDIVSLDSCEGGVDQSAYVYFEFRMGQRAEAGCQRLVEDLR